MPIGWHLDETYIKIKGEWNYLYRAVDASLDRNLYELQKMQLIPQ